MTAEGNVQLPGAPDDSREAKIAGFNQQYGDDNDSGYDDFDPSQIRQAPDNDAQNRRASFDEDDLQSSIGTSRASPAFEEMGPQVTLNQLQEFLAIEAGLRRSCASLPLTFALWITFVLLVFLHGQSRTSYEAASFVSAAIKGAAAPPGFGGFPGTLSLDTVNEHSAVLPWLEGALVPMLSNDPQSMEINQMHEMQMLIGFVKVSQTRGSSMSCFGGRGLVSNSGEVDVPGNEKDKNYARFYAGQCHPYSGYVGTYGPLKEAYELADFAFEAQPGGKNRYEAWLEIGRSEDTIKTRIQTLMEGGWVDLSTQELTLETVFLNSEAHIYCHVLIVMVLHREGWIQKEVFVKPVRGDVYTHWSHIFLDAVWIGILLLLIYQVFERAIDSYERGVFKFYMGDFYTWLDVLSVVFGVLIGLFFSGLVTQLDSFEEKVANLGPMPRFSVDEAPAARKVEAQRDLMAYQDKLSTLFDQIQTVAVAIEWHRLCSFWYSIIVVGRFLRGFTGQPRIAVLIQTILFSMNFLLHFLVVFCIVFANFALGGYILFGGQVEGWSTIGSSINRLFLVLFNHVEFGDLYSVAPVTVSIWYLSFLIGASLLLVNLLLSSILHGYLEVRARLGEPGLSIREQASILIREYLWNRSYEGSRKTAPTEELLKILSVDVDPHHTEKLGRLRVDRRLRRMDDLAKIERSPIVTVDFLVSKGCAPGDAARLLQRACDWKHGIAVTSSPSHRLMLLVARQMSYIRNEVESMAERTKAKVEKSMYGVDRLDLKHAKCVALARRVRRAQELPKGWTAHVDSEGRRYLRQEETGLTSWTLPRHLV